MLTTLHEDWLAFRSSWPSHKRSQMAFEFASGHLAVLDRHDKFIIQHIAMWDLLPRNETSQNMDVVLGLGQSIFSYLCLAHYLGTTPDTAYSLHSDKQIIRPRVLHEEAWKTIEACVMYENQQDWTSFRTTHRALDATLELPKLQVLSETLLTNPDLVTTIPRSSPKPATAESSRSSSVKPSTAESSRSSSVNPELIIPEARDVASKSHMKYLSPPPASHNNVNEDNSKNDLDIPVAQRRAKRQAVLNHAFIKSGV